MFDPYSEESHWFASTSLQEIHTGRSCTSTQEQTEHPHSILGIHIGAFFIYQETGWKSTQEYTGHLHSQLNIHKGTGHPDRNSRLHTLGVHTVPTGANWKATQQQIGFYHVFEKTGLSKQCRADQYPLDEI